MKKLQIILTIAAIFCFTNKATAQPTITFYPSNGTTLTRADVDATLEANGLTRDSEFHAVIEEATEIDGAETYEDGVFYMCGFLLSVSSVSVLIVGDYAFY